MSRVGVKVVLVSGLVLCSAFPACSSKKAEKKGPVGSSAKSNTADPKTESKGPARISLRVDDSKGELYVARPATSKAMEISSFVAAKSIESWKSLEFGLVDGSTKIIDGFASTSKYALTQHDPEGIDFVETNEAGNQVIVVGPLVSMHLHTDLLLRKAPVVDGKTILVVELSGEKIQFSPVQLSKFKEVRIDGPGDRTGWSLLDVISTHVPIAKVARIEAHAGGQVKRFSLDRVKKDSLQMLIRHNKRGEIRLKVFQDGKETDDGLRSLERVVIVLK